MKLHADEDERDTALSKSDAAILAMVAASALLVAGCSAEAAQPAVDKAELGSALSRIICMGLKSNDGGGLCFADGLLGAELSVEAEAFIVRVNETDWDRLLPELPTG